MIWKADNINNTMKEIRSNVISNSNEDSESRLVEGYAVVFNSRSVDLGGFYETIDPRALDGVLEKSDVVCLLDHDIKRGVLARFRNSSNNSLNLKVDEKGLAFSFEAPKTALGDEILEGIRRGDITNCSFAFTVEDEEFTKEADGTILRTIRQIDRLFDISLVYNPAYDETNVDTRGLTNYLNSEQRMTEEEIIKDQEEKDQEKELTQEEKNQCEEKVEEKNDDPKPDDVEKTNDEPDEAEEKEQDQEVEKIDEQDKEEKAPETNKRNSNLNFKTMKNFSLIQTINDVVNNRNFNEVSNEVITRSKNNAIQNGINFGSAQIVLSGINKRAEGDAVVASPNGILAGTATYGSEAVPSEIFDITTALRDSMVLSQAGARFINAQANLDFVAYSGSNCGWGDEIEEAADASGKFSIKKLTPKRLCAVLPISKTFLAQADGSAEALLRQDLVNAVSETLQKTILGSVKGSDAQPQGLMYDVAADTAAFNYNAVLDIESQLEAKNFNVDAAKWVVSPTAKAIMRKTKIDAGSGRFVYENNEVLGVPAFSTNSLVSGGVIYGDFSELIIANWDSMSILVDPYTLAAKNQIRLVVNYYVNYILRREDALIKRIIK